MRTLTYHQMLALIEAGERAGVQTRQLQLALEKLREGAQLKKRSIERKEAKRVTADLRDSKSE